MVKIVRHNIMDKIPEMTAENCLESIRKDKPNIYSKLVKQIKDIEIPQGKVLAIKVKTTSGLIYDVWTKGGTNG